MAVEKKTIAAEKEKSSGVSANKERVFNLSPFPIFSRSEKCCNFVVTFPPLEKQVVDI
jgi:hypothetical protein